MSAEQPLPRASRIGAERRPLPERNATPAAATGRKPVSRADARPMRAVYGAGAVAAMSIVAVGLVQPDWSATADPGVTDDRLTAPGEVASAGMRSGKADVAPADPTPGKRAKGTKPRHVIRYIYLKPGQTAPPGATVIRASAQPNTNTGRNHPSRPVATASPRPRNNGGGAVSSTPPPAPHATRPPAAPRPRPTPTTRQSG
jgi:hypothetical protein